MRIDKVSRFFRLSTALCFCFAFGAAGAYAQISPGPMSQAHSSLDGQTHCISCHDFAKHPPEYNCLDCHKEIRARLDEGRGLHPSMVGTDRSGRSCVACHSEHNGRSFSIVHWDVPPSRFDHRRAGYQLEGKHASLACNACHQPARISATEVKTIAVKDLTRTYLGLSTKCGACHADEHRGQFAADCSSCHDSTRWQNASKFAHDRARFTLTGAHQKVACEKCHMKVDDPKPYTRYRNIAFQDCAPCHNDPHHGAFKAECRSCHSVASWKATEITRAFNHSTTDYPLEGKHAAVACNSCHLSSNFKTPVAHARCMDCHKKDYHQGQFARRADHGDCGSCHKVEGFKPSTFTAAMHARTAFVLADKHAAVPCAKCHIPHGADTVYVFKSDACIECHKDVHQGQFSEAPHQNKCESCHTAKGFKPSTFTLVRHMKSRFPLEGAHGAILCDQCHKSQAGVFPPTPVEYRFNREDCLGCHADPHHGEFDGRMRAVSASGSPRECEACHTMRDWKEIVGFDHSTTSFPLEGAHRSVACEACHKAPNLEPGFKNVSFKSAPRICSGCHDDIHAGQFSIGGAPTDCARCHVLFKWKPSTFNHETGSTFHLAGAHKEVTCGQCHLATEEIAGKKVVMYKPTPRACIACHGRDEVGG